MKRTSVLFAILMLGCASGAPVTPSNAPVPPLWGLAAPGVHEVGYRRVDDSTGAVSVWYPARSSGRRMTVREYLYADTARLVNFLTGAGASDTTIGALLASRTFASFLAKPMDSPFPVVLIAHGNGQDLFDQLVLAEFLASNGFVVASTPSPMIKRPMTNENQIGEFARVQADDMSRALHAVSQSLRVDSTHVAIVGHSFGARSALLMAMSDQRVRALVSLDGGIGTATGRASFESAPGFTSDLKLPPLLHFYERLDAFMAPDFSFLASLRFASATLTPVAELHHQHFTSYAFMGVAFPEIGRLTGASSETGVNASRMYAQIAQFLHRSLRGS